MKIVAGIVAVPTRRENIEKMVEELRKYDIDVKVYYDETYYQTDRKDIHKIKENMNNNARRAYEDTFARSKMYSPRAGVLLMTDDIIFAKRWKEELDRIVSETQGAKVYCMFSSNRKNALKATRGYFLNSSKDPYYDVCSFFALDEEDDIMEEFKEWEKTAVLAKRDSHFDFRFSKFLYQTGKPCIMLSPSLVKHILKSEMGHGDFHTNEFLDDVDKNN